jgi:hypothetical protein
MSDWMTILIQFEAGALAGVFCIGPCVVMWIERRRTFQKSYDTDDTIEIACDTSYKGGGMEMA